MRHCRLDGDAGAMARRVGVPPAFGERGGVGVRTGCARRRNHAASSASASPTAATSASATLAVLAARTNTSKNSTSPTDTRLSVCRAPRSPSSPHAGTGRRLRMRHGLLRPTQKGGHEVGDALLAARVPASRRPCCPPEPCWPRTSEMSWPARGCRYTCQGEVVAVLIPGADTTASPCSRRGGPHDGCQKYDECDYACTRPTCVVESGHFTTTHERKDLKSPARCNRIIKC